MLPPATGGVKAAPLVLIRRRAEPAPEIIPGRIREPTQLDRYAAEPGPMAAAGPEAPRAVRKLVEGEAIAYLRGVPPLQTT